ncbi:WXG100 family type VII secretion target [Jatrophihabitans fulvus]
MSEIKVNFGALEAGEQGIRANYAKLTATLDQLESGLNPMIQSWSGSAQESYLQCKKQWDDAALALSQVLNNIGQAVGQANQNYQAAEHAAKSNWG